MRDDAALEALRASVRGALASAYPAAERRRLLDDKLGHDPQTWRLLADQLGLAGLTVPEEYGGAGAGAEAEQVVFEELGAALYAGPFFACAGLAVPTLVEAAAEESRAGLLGAIAAGDLVATVATTEPGRGWDVADVATTGARGGGGDWRLSGTKGYVPDLAAADVVLVSAQTAHGLSLFAVTPGDTGVSALPTPALDLTRRLSTLGLRDAPARLLSGTGDVTSDLARARDRSLVALTAEQVGGATACLELAVTYAREREQFDRPIGQFQAIKHLCADMLVDLEEAAALAAALARRCDAGDELALLAALAKAACSDAFFSIAARTIQVFGGIGFTWEHDAHLYYRRAKSTQLLFGDSAAQRRRVGEELEW